MQKEKLVLVNFQTTELTRAVFHRVAQVEGLSLSAWLRRLAIKRASELEAAGIRPETQEAADAA